MAQQPLQKPMVGRRVVQRSDEFALHIENRVVDCKRVIHFYTLSRSTGPGYRYRPSGNGLSGRALVDQVISVEEAVVFFSDQIRDDTGNVFPYVMRAMLWQDRKEIDHGPAPV